jgi:histone-lysine N-methyltransferase SETD3
MTQLWNNYLDISEVLLKVKRLEEMKTESSQRSQGIGQFMNWLTENGARMDGVSIAEFPGYDLGLKAEADFAENQLILEIPRALIFSTYTAAPELTALQNDPLVQHMPQVALAIALLVERYKENSLWKPYLDMLPNSYNTVLYMKANDMIELKGSPTLGTRREITFTFVLFYFIFHTFIVFIHFHFTFTNLFYTIFHKDKFLFC